LLGLELSEHLAFALSEMAGARGSVFGADLSGTSAIVCNGKKRLDVVNNVQNIA
jgi:hypothetical protein